MEKVRCPNGHWYDAEKSKDCPYCRDEEKRRKELEKSVENAVQFPAFFESIREDVTVPLRPAPRDETVRLGSHMGNVAGLSASREPITVGIVSRARGNAYLTGWLVGKNGKIKGRDYRLTYGRNFIGSDPNMDVCIREDPGIVGKHCAVAYDAKSNGFYVVAEEGCICYLNGEMLIGSTPLKLGDEIQLGDSVFEFVPFCREGHTWDIEE